ncbi:sulfotransferase [Alteromonas sp. KUL49]|uniref:tetratricopeptide repeat-containing sulfotransferase family protein n=1 Tax=Alteromonas sp. KUL49 TaxID=2480798 RepID=UPI0013EEDFB0|nr:sulfotransferase [Alteromonas sp. KUL49]
MIKISSKPWTGLPKKVLIKQALSDAQSLAQQGNWRLCLDICEHVERKVKDHPQTIYLRALHAASLGHAAKSAVLFKSIYDSQNGKLPYLLNYANALYQSGNRADVLTLIEANEKAFSSDLRGLKLAVDIYTYLNQNKCAAKYIRTLIKKQPDEVVHRLALANTYHRSLDDEAALAVLDDALRKFPNHPELLFTKASILEIQNTDQQALDLVIDILEQGNHSAHGYILAAKLSRKLNRMSEAYQYLDKAKQELSNSNQDTQRAYLGERLAQARLSGNYKLAYETAVAQKQGRKKSTDRDWQILEKHRACVSQFVPSTRVVKEESDSSSPHLFIVGFPRCGSTLLERLLCSNFVASSYGESDVIPRVISSLTVNKTDEWWSLADDAWNCANQKTLSDPTYYDQSTASVDKNLFNGLRIPFIRHLDTNAVVIRCLRDPLSIVMSNFFANYMQYEPWQYSVESITKFLFHVDTVWDATVNPCDERIVTVKYEEVTQRNGIPSTLDVFLGKYWGAQRVERGVIKQRALAFSTRTASYEQVTKNITTTANDEYKHYISMIPPSVKIKIAELQEKWGYELAV